MQRAQHDKQDRCPDANSSVGQQEPIPCCRNAHQRDRDKECVFPPQLVAQHAEQECAQWPHAKAHAEHGQGLQEGGAVTPRGKEQLPDQCRERAVDKIIPFENRAREEAVMTSQSALDIHLARITHF